MYAGQASQRKLKELPNSQLHIGGIEKHVSDLQERGGFRGTIKKPEEPKLEPSKSVVIFHGDLQSLLDQVRTGEYKPSQEPEPQEDQLPDPFVHRTLERGFLKKILSRRPDLK